MDSQMKGYTGWSLRALSAQMPACPYGVGVCSSTWCFPNLARVGIYGGFTWVKNQFPAPFLSLRGEEWLKIQALESHSGLSDHCHPGLKTLGRDHHRRGNNTKGPGLAEATEGERVHQGSAFPDKDVLSLGNCCLCSTGLDGRVGRGEWGSKVGWGSMQGHLLLLFSKAQELRGEGGVLGPELKRQVLGGSWGRSWRRERLSGSPRGCISTGWAIGPLCPQPQPTALHSSGWMTKAWEPGTVGLMNVSGMRWGPDQAAGMKSRGLQLGSSWRRREAGWRKPELSWRPQGLSSVTHLPCSPRVLGVCLAIWKIDHTKVLREERTHTLLQSWKPKPCMPRMGVEELNGRVSCTKDEKAARTEGPESPFHNMKTWKDIDIWKVVGNNIW